VTELENARQKAASNNAVTGGSIPARSSSGLGHLDQARRVRQARRDIQQHHPGVDAVANQQTVDSAIPVGPNGSPSDNKKGKLTFTRGRPG